MNVEHEKIQFRHRPNQRLPHFDDDLLKRYNSTFFQHNKCTIRQIYSLIIAHCQLTITIPCKSVNWSVTLTMTVVCGDQGDAREAENARKWNYLRGARRPYHTQLGGLIHTHKQLWGFIHTQTREANYYRVLSNKFTKKKPDSFTFSKLSRVSVTLHSSERIFD